MTAEHQSPGADEKFTPAIELEAPDNPVQPNMRQQGKIIRFLDSGDPTVIAHDAVEITPEERQRFLEEVADNGLAPERASGLINSIKPRVPEKVNATDLIALYNEIAIDPGQRGILADFSRREPDQHDGMSAAKLSDFLDHYPNPVAFDEPARLMAERVGQVNAPNVTAAYEANLRGFANTVYGKRQEYWEQVKLLRDEAAALERPKTPDEQAETMPPQISAEASKYLLGLAEIHGSPRKGRTLTTEILAENGLEPKHQVELDGVNIFFSDVYDIGDGRKATVGYVHTPDKDKPEGRVVARSYYQSNSQGMWRYEPNYYGDMGALDKGHNEDSLNLPIPAQAALGALGREVKPARDAALAFYGTARNLFENGPGTYYSVVGAAPDRLEGKFYTHKPGVVLSAPETLDFDSPNDSPDFEAMVARWDTDSSLHGKLTMEAYSSADKRHRYIFARDAENRVMIAGTENNSSINHTGVREEWTDAGDLTVPLYDYFEQSNGYGNSRDVRGNYVQMWDNYLSKAPVIQRYLKHKGLAAEEQRAA